MRIEPLGPRETPIVTPAVSHYDKGEDTLVKTNQIVGWSYFDTLSFAPKEEAPMIVPGITSQQDLALVEEQRRQAPTCPFLGLNGHSGFAMAV